MLETPKAYSYFLGNNGKDKTMDNQQVTPYELGWLAGIIDGEGYLGLQKENDKRNSKKIRYKFTPCIHITNCDEAIVLKSRDIIKKLGANFYVRACKGRKNTKDHYRLQTRRFKNILIVLKATIPYLTGTKQERAKLLLEFCKLRKEAPKIIECNKGQGGKRWCRPYTKPEVDIFDKLKPMQKRGQTSETARQIQRLKSELWQGSQTARSCNDTVRSYVKT